MISIAVPVYDIPERDFFMRRLQDSLNRQTYSDWELVETEAGKMAENTNAAINACEGEIIKILYMDDYLAHENSLKNIVDNFKGGWLATGCLHDDGVSVGNPHLPTWNDDILEGMNTIGSPSVIAFENKKPLFFDEKMTWLLDCDYYHRLHKRYGEPTLLDSYDVVIGIGSHQATHKLSDEIKVGEHKYLHGKYTRS